MIQTIAKWFRKEKFRKKFNKMDCIKGLNPDKHEQVFNAYWYSEENGLDYNPETKQNE